MRRSTQWLLASLGGLVIVGSGLVMTPHVSAKSTDTPTTAPSETTGTKTRTKLIKPYSELSDLSDDQKSQLISIHEKAGDQMKAIEAQEKTDMQAVLTADQKAELAAMDAKEKADKKKQAAEERAARKKEKMDSATTQP